MLAWRLEALGLEVVATMVACLVAWSIASATGALSRARAPRPADEDFDKSRDQLALVKTFSEIATRSVATVPTVRGPGQPGAAEGGDEPEASRAAIGG